MSVVVIKELLNCQMGGEGGKRGRETVRDRVHRGKKNRVVFISINYSGYVLSPVVCSCKLHASAVPTARHMHAQTHVHKQED